MARAGFLKLLESELPPRAYQPGERVEVAQHLLPVWQGMISNHLGVDFTNATHRLFKVSGPLDIDRLELAVRQLTLRFPILTARVHDEGARPAFVFGHPDEPRLERLRTHSGNDRLAKFAATKAITSIWRRFGYPQQPLSRFFVISASREEHYFGIVLNHFIADAQSVSIAAGELLRLYHSNLLKSDLRPEILTFPVYAHVVETWSQSSAGAAARDYWRSALEGAVATGLPPRRGPSISTAHSRDTIRGTLPASALAELRGAAKKAGSTLFLLLLAAKLRALSDLTGQDDLGVLVLNQRRNLPCLMNMIGNMTDLLPIRLRLGLDRSLPEVVRRLRSTWGSAQTNSLLPHRMIMDDGQDVPMPIFNFIDQSSALPDPGFKEGLGDTVSFIEFPSPWWPRVSVRKIEFEPFYFLATTDISGLYITMRYAPDKFDREVGQEFLERFFEILRIEAVK